MAFHSDPQSPSKNESVLVASVSGRVGALPKSSWHHWCRTLATLHQQRYLRCVQTALVLAKHFKTDLLLDQELAEVHGPPCLDTHSESFHLDIASMFILFYNYIF